MRASRFGTGEPTHLSCRNTAGLRRRRHPRRSTFGLALVCALGWSSLGACCTGCASASAGERSTDDQDKRWLARSTLDERSRPVELVRADVSPPPGVDPSAIVGEQADPAQGERRAMPLDEAIADAAEGVVLGLPVPPERIELPFAQRIEAEALYVRGLAASMNGAYMNAVAALGRASQIDPGASAIQRQLARALIGMRSEERALGAYRMVLALEPGDTEASLALAMRAGQTRRFRDAITLLEHAGMPDAFVPHSDGADAVAYYVLGASLLELGYDHGGSSALRMGLERLNEPTGVTMYQDQLRALRRDQDDLWRMLGDAHLRLGELGGALDAYALADARADGGQQGIATISRVLYVNLLIDRPATAATSYLGFLSNFTGEDVTALARMASWLADALPEAHRAHFRRLLVDRWESSDGDLRLARIAAASLPAREARSLLAEVASVRLRDAALLRSLFRTSGPTTWRASFELAVALVDEHPSQAFHIADRLFEVIGVPPDALVVQEGGDARGAARALIASRLAWHADAHGVAWQVLKSIEGAETIEEMAKLQGLTIASSLQELHLFESIDSELRNQDSVIVQLARGESLLRVNRIADALDAARRATELAPEDDRAWLLRAQVASRDPRAAEEAVDAARRAIELNPSTDRPYEVLFRVYGNGGSMPNRQRLVAVVRELEENLPESVLYVTEAAGDVARRGSVDDALTLLLAHYEQYPWSERLVTRLIASWLEIGQGDRARGWLRAKRASRPHDPLLLGQLVRVGLSSQNVEDALQVLRERHEKWPHDPVSSRLLEIIYRSTSQDAKALDLGLARLRLRPAGVSRTIERIGMLASAHSYDEAIRQIDELLAEGGPIPRASFDQLLAASSLLPDDQPASLRARIALVDAFNAQFDGTSFTTFAVGMLSSAKLGDVEAFDRMLRGAMAEAPDLQDMTDNTARVVQSLVQSLHDADAPGLAARFLETRLTSHHALDEQYLVLLAQLAQASWIEAGAVDGAIAVIDRLAREGNLNALPINPQGNDPHAQALYSLSTLASLLGREEIAEQLLLRTIALDPDHAMAANNLGYRRIENDSLTEADVERLNAAYERLSDDPNVLDTVAWLRYRQGRFKRSEAGEPGAIELLDRALDALTSSEETPSPEALDHRGDTLWRLGRHDEAAKAWREALERATSEAFRNDSTQGYVLYQERLWGLRLRTGEAVFEHLHGERIRLLRQKIEAVEAGLAPTITPTFNESRAGDT